VFIVKAARFLGQDKIEWIEEKKPALSADDDVIVKVTCCGLCGSDKRLFHNGASHIPGHEIAGVVYEAGPKASIQPGARVIVYIPIFCGTCKYCLAGETNRCQHIEGLVGWQRNGGYAEYVKVPCRNVIPIPDDLTDTDGVLLLDTIGTAAHAIRLALNVRKTSSASDKALVIGCGPLGLGSILTFKAFGIDTVFASDPSDERLSIALEFGALPYRASGDQPESDFAIVIEASGSASGRKIGMYAVEPGGAFVVLGESNDPFVIQPTPALRRKDFYSIRSFYFSLNEVEANIDLYRKHQTAFQKLVSKVVPLEQLEETFVEFCQGKTIKPFVRMEA
jgi:threonine dehydrogenase-like Zn-dependent dehydrogenase